MSRLGDDGAIVVAADAPRIHFILVPLMSQGHIIPMVDLARLLAQRGAMVSVATTSLNADRVRKAMDRAATCSNLPLRLNTLPFPLDAVGFPPGVDNIDMLPDIDLGIKFMAVLPLLADSLKDYIRTATPRIPTCLISDFCHTWTWKVAAELGVPRYVFYSMCCFTLHCAHVLQGLFECAGVTSHESSGTMVVPDIPHRIEITQAQAPVWPVPELAESTATAEGIIVNTFAELEPEYVEMFGNDTGKKVWPVGPVSLCEGDREEKAARGDRSAVDESEILAWLDSQASRSVIYVSFGSLMRPHPLQLKELGAALEASEKPFLWVMRPHDKQKPEIDAWLAGGFYDRTKARGLIVQGWAPQVLIMSHPSIGAHLTHCGWNSSLEAITMGVPIITWPGLGDQFMNEKFHVEVARTGVSVGIKDPISWYFCDEAVPVNREQIEEAVRKVMDTDQEAEDRRQRAAKMAEKAKKAMDVEGSSYKNLTSLMEEAMQLARKTVRG